MTPFEEKLLLIFECIEGSCTSSVKIFDSEKGHTSRSVGFAAFEERQKKILELSERRPDVIEFLCKRGQHNYFKFNGGVIKIVSSPRDGLGTNVFERNVLEREEFSEFDPLIRIIYKTDYDLMEKDATLLECHYLVIDRNTKEVLEEINLMDLAKESDGVIRQVNSKQPDAVDIPAASLLDKIEELKSPKDRNSDEWV